MANSTKKPAASKSGASATKKSSANQQPERDEYAYYDDLYKKKPKKNKKPAEQEEQEVIEYYEDTSSKKNKKKANAPEPAQEQENLPPASTQVIHRLMPYILGVVTVFIIACFLLATVEGAMGDLGVLLRDLFFGLLGWPAYFIPLILVNLII